MATKDTPPDTVNRLIDILYSGDAAIARIPNVAAIKFSNPPVTAIADLLAVDLANSTVAAVINIISPPKLADFPSPRSVKTRPSKR